MTQKTHSETILAKRTLPRARQLQLLTIVIAVIGGITLMGWLSTRLFAKAETSNASEAVPPNTFRATDAQLSGLKIQTVETASFQTVETTDGKIALNADTTTPVFSPYSGRVIKVIAGIGDYVKQGAPLFSVAAAEYSQALSDLHTAQSQLTLAQLNEARKHGAFEAKGGSLQDWQQAQADLVAAESSFATARNRLHVFGKSDVEIDALAHEKSSEAITYVVAPISGVVTDRQVGPGQFLQAGSGSAVYTIADLSSVWLVANIREVDAPRVRRGQSIDVHVLAIPGKTFTSKLSAVGASVDAVTRRVPVRAVLDNSAGLLKPEMFATFDIESGDATVAPAVPSDAVIYEGQRARVWVLQNSHDIGLREIRTGRTMNGEVEVLDGLKAGERIVTSGSLFIDRAARPE